MSTRQTDARSFARWVALITAVGLVGRVVYVLLVTRHQTVWGDAYFYHESSNLIAQGKGFINPIDWIQNHVRNQAADHPPLYLIYLAGWSWLGVTSTTGHLLVSTLLGAATIAVTAYAGKEIAGRRVGLIAAVIVCIYPNVWAPDGMLLSETMAILTVAVTMLLAYRFWHRPSLARAAWMGVAVGLATMSRSELILLSVLVIVPLVLLVRTVSLWRRIGWIGAAAATCLAVVGPWVAFNMTRFDHPVYLSAGYEITLSTSTCDLTWYGEFTGYWNIQCPIQVLQRHGVNSQGTDQSVLAKLFRDDSIEYIRNHEKRLPYVILARWGRITGLYKPLQQVDLDHFPEGRNIWVARAALAGWFIVAPLAIGGAISLRKRRIPVFPLLGPPIVVMVAVTITFATTRYRASAEGAICLLAAVGVDALITFYQRLRDDPEDARRPSAPGPLGDGEQDEGRGVDRLGDRELVGGDRG